MSVPKPFYGCFTRQSYLQGATLHEIELRLGFYGGRLARGAKFFVATVLPGIDDFELAGYTQVATHHTQDQYGDINHPKDRFELDAYKVKKQNAIDEWSLRGDHRLVKVTLLVGVDTQMEPDKMFPPGTGIPQWVVKKERPILCREMTSLSDYPNGRFIPDEGYTPVNYGR